MIRWLVVIVVILASSSFFNFITNNKIGIFGWVLICSIIFYFGINLLAKSLSKSKNQNIQIGLQKELEERKSQINENIAFTWPSVGNFDFEVVGESNYQDSLRKLGANATDTRLLPAFTAILFPENNNKFDKMAVRVDIDGITVGYLSREDAREYRKFLNRKGIAGKATSCDATLTGGFVKNDGTRASYGVYLDIDLNENEED